MDASELAYDVRPLKPEEVCQVYNMFVKEGGNTSQQYLLNVHASYPPGFLGAVTDAGLVIGTCTTTPIGDSAAYLSGYVTLDGYRRRGIGRRVFQASVAPFQHKNVFLDAVAGKPELYKSLGFTIEGPIIVEMKAAPDRSFMGKECDTTVKIVPVSEVDMASIEEYDLGVHHFDRRTLLHSCLQHCFKGFVAVRDGQVRGYACLYDGPLSYSMMPLYADNSTIAHMLWDACLQHVETSAEIEIAHFKSNEKAASMYRCYKMDSGGTDELIRLSTKTEMFLPSDKVFAVMQHNTLV